MNVRKFFIVMTFLTLAFLAGWRMVPPIEPMFGGKKVSLPPLEPPIERFWHVEATAYAPPLFPEGQLTFCETPVGWGTIAVDPKFIPLRSKVRLLTHDKGGKLYYLFKGQEFIAFDTGRLIKKNIIDIWMPSYEEAINWGRRQIIMEIVHMSS